MKDLWYNFVVNNKDLWPRGFTLKRLEKVREAVLKNEDILWDLLDRHGASDKTPEQMLKDDGSCYEHCIGNFVSNILTVMIDKKVYKP